MNEIETYPKEDVLEDDYPVHFDYCYVCDGKVEISPVGGGATVRDLKRALQVSEVKRCNMDARGFFG